MEQLYSTLLPYGRVHCLAWSGTNLVAISLSEQLPEYVTEGNERSVCSCCSPWGVCYACMYMWYIHVCTCGICMYVHVVYACIYVLQGESELSSCIRSRPALDLPQVSFGRDAQNVWNFILGLSKHIRVQSGG